MHLVRLLALPLFASAACTFTISDSSDSASSNTSTATGTDATTSGSTTSPTSGADDTTSDATTSTSTTDASTTAPTPTESSETGPTPGACGWVDEQNIYACGGMGEDPDGLIPIDCPEPPVTDAPCDGDQGPIADPGCCYEGTNAYCYLGKLIVTVCR